PLAIGDAAPDFSLKGVDDRTHALKDFADAKVLVVVFTCNHCPTANAYAGRIQKLHDDFKDKGVALVAISPNDPLAVRLDELSDTDVGDSFEDMKTRAKEKSITYPYLYDGQTQKVSLAYGVLATPHVFVFDRDRKLRYNGRIDDAEVKEPKSHDARNAIEAGLAGGAGAGREDPGVRLLDQVVRQAGGRAEGAGEVGRRAGRPRRDRRRRGGQAGQERHEEAPGDQRLGLVVRAVRGRAARVRHHEPD